MICYQPHRLDQDVRRLRLRFLPNHACGKVALLSHVPSDSTSLRDCAAQGEGFGSIWQPIATVMQTWIRDGYGAHTFRTISSTGPPWQSVVRRITKDLKTSEVLEYLVVNPSGQQFYYATYLVVPGAHKPSRITS